MFLLFQFPWNLLIASFITHKYLSNKHPVQYKNFCYNFAYYSVYLYSKAEIIYIKMKPTIMNFLEPILQSELFKNFCFYKDKTLVPLEIIEFVKDGKVIHHCLREKLYELTEVYEFDFILYSSPDPEYKEIINKKMLYRFPLTTEDFIIEKTNYLFMLTEINIEDSDSEQSIKIELVCKKYNYFIVNNKINTAFLKYFLKKYHDYNLSSNKYNIRIIDENIHVKTVSGVAFEKIVLNKNNFEIETETETTSESSINIFQSFDGKKISDYITFSNSDVDLPGLIPIDERFEEDYVEIDNFN
jgi:hypothetical protein